MRLRPLLPALALLALPVLAGCGGSDAPAPLAAAPSASATAGSAETDTLIQAAAARTTETSSKIVLTSRTQLNGQDVTFVGEGAYDYVAKKGQFTFALPGGGGTIEQRMVGENLYLSLPQEPGTFFKIALADLAGTSLGNTTDPSASLNVLDVLENTTKVGEEKVRGVDTTVYEGTLDPAKAVAEAEGAAKTILENSLAKLGVDSIPVTVHLDGQDRVVKLEQVIELDSGLKSTTIIEVFDFGTAVTVAEPPAAAVKDGAPLLAALKAAPGLGAPAASPAPAAASPAPASPAASPAG